MKANPDHILVLGVSYSAWVATDKRDAPKSRAGPPLTGLVGPAYLWLRNKFLERGHLRGVCPLV